MGIENTDFCLQIPDRVNFNNKNHEAVEKDNQESSIQIIDKIIISKAPKDFLNVNPEDFNLSNISDSCKEKKVVYNQIKDSLLCYKSKYDTKSKFASGNRELM